MLKQMFSNFRKNFKNKNNISSSQKNSSVVNDFMDINKESYIYQKDNNKQNELLNEFNKNIIRIILNSRKGKNNDFSINTSKISDNTNSCDASFNLEIDDLFLYNDFFQDKNELQKIVIEFYIIKKRGAEKIKELVEKWKFCYKLNNTDNNLDITMIKNKMKIYIKSIIAYSRLLPLYQYNISNNGNENYIIDFKLYQNSSSTKGKFSQKPSGNVNLKNPDLFSFKLNIKYYMEKELKQYLSNDEKNTDIMIPNKLKSLSFHKHRGKGNLKILESINTINNYNNDDNPINCLLNEMDYVEHNIKTCETEINKNKMKEINPDSDDSFCLIFDSEEEKKKNVLKNNLKETEIINKRKCSFLSNGYETTEDCSPRNSHQKNNNEQNENNYEKNTSPFSSRASCIKTENKKINKILKDYSSLKNMIEYLNCPITIKKEKLFEYECT